MLYPLNTKILKNFIENACSNGFAAAILYAYNYHKHLNPDDVWLAISQGVSYYINYNPEKFRDRFVQHNNYGVDWPEVVNRLVTVTDSMSKNLFKGFYYLICGIPKVTFEGTLEDWMKLQEKITHLRKLNSELDFCTVHGSGGELDVIVDVPFNLYGLNLKFMAGFIGANQEILKDSDGESVVTPVIGWSIIDNLNDTDESDRYYSGE
ncbi:20428_t:CDS:2 [Dentiscutata erythropus]|uniref:20428_t:CDS:1 n=1 Tax=Dentiscutata erythropus TaxID=1348616 RepID=A0A9N9AH02_9GLOM|nr:20428_t:CDS:2 [Dentiscutata erythropus]